MVNFDKQNLNPVAVGAILSFIEQVKFEKVFGVFPETLVPVTNGYQKNVLMSNDKCYNFYRNQACFKAAANEIPAYQFIKSIKGLLAPKLLAVCNDIHISPYPIFVTSRCFGNSFKEEIIHGMSDSKIEQVFIDLAIQTAKYHKKSILKTNVLPHPQPFLKSPIDADNWLYLLLNEKTFKRTLLWTFNQLPYAVFKSRKTRKKIEDIVLPLLSLENIFCHGDLHDDQVLVEQGRLSAILDWGYAQINHPLCDFNYNEWKDYPYKAVLMRQIHSIRRKALKAYNKARKINIDPDAAETVFRLFYLVVSKSGGAVWKKTLYKNLVKENIDWFESL